MAMSREVMLTVVLISIPPMVILFIVWWLK